MLTVCVPISWVYTTQYNVLYFCYDILVCLPFNASDNGNITCSLGSDGKPNPGDTCTFTCNDGYELSDSDSRTCTDTGVWNGTEPTCKLGTLFCVINSVFT